MSERGDWLIWERSPPPMDEPLLRDEEEAAGQEPASAKEDPAPVKSAEEEALDQEELQLFWCAPISPQQATSSLEYAVLLNNVSLYLRRSIGIRYMPPFLRSRVVLVFDNWQWLCLCPSLNPLLC